MFDKILNSKIAISLILLAFSIYVVRLFINKEITLFIHPRYTLFALIMSVLAIIIILAGLLIRQNHSHETKNNASNFINIIVVIALTLILITPNHTLSSNVMNDRSVQFLEYSEPDGFISCPDKTPVGIESLTTGIGWYGASCFESEVVTLTGFVVDSSLSHPLPSNMFYMGRFVVSCCAIDAQTYAVPIVVNNGADIPQDSWIEVKGTVRTKIVNGSTMVVVEMNDIKQIDEPENPYEYLGG